MKKKIMLIAMSIVMVIAALALTACGESGTYKFSKIYVNAYGMEITVNAGDTNDTLEAMLNVDLTEELMVLELKSDKTFALSSTLNPEGEGSQIGTWEKKDGKLVLTMSQEIDGETVSESIELMEENGQYVFDMSQSGMTMKLYLAKK